MKLTKQDNVLVFFPLECHATQVYKDNHKYEDDLKYEDCLKYEDNLKYENDFKSENNFKNQTKTAKPNIIS